MTRRELIGIMERIYKTEIIDGISEAIYKYGKNTLCDFKLYPEIPDKKKSAMLQLLKDTDSMHADDFKDAVWFGWKDQDGKIHVIPVNIGLIRCNLVCRLRSVIVNFYNNYYGSGTQCKVLSDATINLHRKYHLTTVELYALLLYRPYGKADEMHAAGAYAATLLMLNQ